jgi:hypothetical protein
VSEVLSVRVPKGTTKLLKLIAARRSLAENREVRWSSLVRDSISRILADSGREGCPCTKVA